MACRAEDFPFVDWPANRNQSVETMESKMSTHTVYIKKADKSYTFDTFELPAATLSAIIEYGMTQKLSDSVSDVSLSANVDGRKIALTGKELEAARKAAREGVDETFADLLKGVLRKTRTTDAVGTRARQIAIRMTSKSVSFKAWLADHHVKATDKAAVDELQSRAEKLAAMPNIVQLATRQIADEAALGITDLDADDESAAA